MKHTAGAEDLVAALHNALIENEPDRFSLEIREAAAGLGKHQAHRDDVPDLAIEVHAAAEAPFQRITEIHQRIGGPGVAHPAGDARQEPGVPSHLRRTGGGIEAEGAEGFFQLALAGYGEPPAVLARALAQGAGI